VGATGAMQFSHILMIVRPKGQTNGAEKELSEDVTQPIKRRRNNNKIVK
jgi:hypothetical protein